MRDTHHQFWRQCQSIAVSGLAIALLTSVGYRFHVNSTTVALYFLLIIVLQSVFGGSVASMIVALEAAACLDFFFLQPLLSFRLADPVDALALFVYPITALIVTYQVSRVRIETQRRLRRDIEVQAEVFRTAILDALAHEFKTPLATILAVIGGIRESRKLQADQEEMAEMIESEVSRLNDLTSRLLRTARLDREELKPRLESLDIVPFVDRLVHRYMSRFQERQVAVTSCCTSVEAPADRQLLDLALTQLLDNALKYSLPATTITVRIQAEEGFITTSVKNDGNPIARDEERRIFERFYRGVRVRPLVSGTGLGLYVARKIAAAHGGSLDLINDESCKSVIFSLKLPISNHECNFVATSR